MDKDERIAQLEVQLAERTKELEEAQSRVTYYEHWMKRGKMWPTQISDWQLRAERAEAALAQAQTDANATAANLLDELAAHVRDNAEALKKYDWEANEARCRELCAMYLSETARNLRQAAEYEAKLRSLE